jgi:hypothetical protein
VSDSDVERAVDGRRDDLRDASTSTETNTTIEPFDDSSLESDGDNDRAHELPAGPSSTPKRPDRGMLIACFVIACGLATIIWGVGSAITGQDGIDRPTAIEDLSPVENAQQVVQQEQIVVNLQFGYEAALVIDGIELPTSRLGEFRGDLTPQAGQQISIPPTAVFDPGNSRIEFRPSDDALITSYTEGRHQVQVIYWRIEDGRENGAASYRWAFDVI